MSDSSHAVPQDALRTGTTNLLARIEAYADARRRADTHTLADPDRSDPTVTVRHAELMSALHDLTRTTVTAVPNPRLPVCTWRKGVVEVRAIAADGSRAVRVRYTPAQAIAAGTALIACGAVADTTTGGTLGPILPPFPTSPDRVPAQDASGAPVEHDCHAAGTLTFVAEYGAPGVGQEWTCTECGRAWARLGERLHPAEDGAHILSPRDYI
ncbi:hypothetical protein EDC02_5020 [Micromonospora sp. Llam0]|uniref:hypothetical protein n=1 Tax=Micromonospora sp. Llam0 TaxID=2485143 RepID=UPI000FC1B669|nr:hypothetical protein [Micromonospora sp. Llam0]ROO63010.1 hypothetical protein EDC02_5020 [Micromonospora sp. Llam0]